MASENIVTVTDTNFADEIGGHQGLSMVDFWAEWCAPCKMIAPAIEQLAGEYDEEGLRVGKLDVDSNPRIAAQFGVRSIPSVLFFKDGQHVDTVVGAVPKAVLEGKIQQLA